MKPNGNGRLERRSRNREIAADRQRLVAVALEALLDVVIKAVQPVVLCHRSGLCSVHIAQEYRARWRITLMRAKGQCLGRAEATAVKVITEQFVITDPHHATPVRRGI